MSRAAPPWTTATDLTATLARRWRRGTWAATRADGGRWEPVGVAVRGPSAADLLEHLDEARAWVDRFARDSCDRAGRPRWRVEHRVVRSRAVGSNQVPAKVWLDSLEQACAAIGASDELAALDEVVGHTRAHLPAGLAWVVAHPLAAAAERDAWERMVATVAWIEDHETTGVYLRQLDVEGVDTKFVERHRSVLDGLLTAVLPAERIDTGAGVGDFARRFRFRPKPAYVRLRSLGPQPGLPVGITEVRLRADELPAAGIEAATVYVVENEVTFLAFPPVADAVVVFGSGYGVEAANAEAWMAGRRLVYWGDIDTHGLAILDKLRGRFPDVTSMLMDVDTLLAHPAQWAVEPVPVRRHLARLTPAEAQLHADLVEDRYGRSVRLEQERVRYSLLLECLHAAG